MRSEPQERPALPNVPAPEPPHIVQTVVQCPRCAEDRRTAVKRVKVSEGFIAELKDGSRPVFVLKIEEEPDGDLLFVVKRADPYVTRNDVSALREIIADAETVLGNTQLWLLRDLAARLEAVVPKPMEPTP